MRAHTLTKSALFVGYLGISAAVAVAYNAPVTGYELDIYAGTPASFWGLVSLAVLLSVLVVFWAAKPHVRAAGGALGLLAMTVTVSLPIIRGYYYIGDADPLSHLGTAKVLSSGAMSMTESRYPAVHTLGSVLHMVTGLSVRHVMLVTVVVFLVCFFVFVPLVVRELTGDTLTTYVGLFSGLLLLPINHLGAHQYVFPTSQAVLFAPAFLLVFFLVFYQRTARLSGLFLVVATTFVILHPQQAANLLLLSGVVVAGQVGYDFWRGVNTDQWRRWLLPEVGFFATVFSLWVWNLEMFWGTLQRVALIPFQDTTVGGKAATRTGSLEQIGGSLLGIFLKLFSVQLLYVLLTGLLLVIALKYVSGGRRWYTRASRTSGQMLPMYLYGGLVALTLLFVVFLVGGVSDQYFRHLAMMMVFGTILGAIALGRGFRALSERLSPSVSTGLVVVVLCLCFALSLPVVFASPYIYYDSQHVTESGMHGYETTFEYQDRSTTFDDIRSSTYRYGHAVGESDRPGESYYAEGNRGIHSGEHGIPDHFANRSLRTYYDRQQYVPVPEADRVRDPVLWEGFRFSDADFAYLDSEPGIDKVQSNGGYDLYLVDPAGARNGTDAT
ncbi:hypothetical protein [Haloarcula laminariae]|uniref:hypothetical protein n=1 Tax=Haloarcula laminariae TaxID=2961577 RepID=UPI00240645CA|nr:hypothetical protein [Halomicroarcula sp. FL173]